MLYMAPEVVSGRPSSFSADYWSLGVVLFEFLTGCPPFDGDTEQEVFEKVTHGAFADDDLQGCSDEVRDLIGKLLRQNPDERLGARSIEEIKRHPWFDGIDWDNLHQLPAPFVPVLQSDDDTGCFVERGRPDSWDNGSIRQDIEAARREGSLHRRTSSLSGEDDGIEMFGSMSIPTLQEATEEDARRLRLKRSSQGFKIDDDDVVTDVPMTPPTRQLRRRTPRESLSPRFNTPSCPPRSRLAMSPTSNNDV
jgi:serine/threonine protein kinase